MNGQNLSYFLLNSSGLENCLFSFAEGKAGLNIMADATKLPIHCPIWQKYNSCIARESFPCCLCQCIGSVCKRSFPVQCKLMQAGSVGWSSLSMCNTSTDYAMNRPDFYMVINITMIDEEKNSSTQTCALIITQSNFFLVSLSPLHSLGCILCGIKSMPK